jgi:PadR family transcriptional regulator AphA
MGIRSKTRFAILGLLCEGPLSGYDIKKLIDIRFRLFWNESFGQIYPELGKLQQEGLISRKSDEKHGDKKRHVYKITKKGINALKVWLEKPVEKEVMRLEILLKIYFGNLSDKTFLIQHIQEFQSRHKKNLAVLNLLSKEVAGIPDEKKNHKYVLMTIEFGKKVYKAYLEWCEYALSILVKKQRRRKEK